jgi:chaperonin GroES
MFVGIVLGSPAAGRSLLHSRPACSVLNCQLSVQHVRWRSHLLEHNRVWSHMKVTPLHDRLIVQRLDEGERTVGGIIVPDSAKEKPQRGTVCAVGQGKVRDDGSRQLPDVKSGDTILFGKYSGQEIKIDGEDYLIMREDDVLAIIDSK